MKAQELSQLELYRNPPDIKMFGQTLQIFQAPKISKESLTSADLLLGRMILKESNNPAFHAQLSALLTKVRSGTALSAEEQSFFRKIGLQADLGKLYALNSDGSKGKALDQNTFNNIHQLSILMTVPGNCNPATQAYVDNYIKVLEQQHLTEALSQMVDQQTEALGKLDQMIKTQAANVTNLDQQGDRLESILQRLQQKQPISTEDQAFLQALHIDPALLNASPNSSRPESMPGGVLGASHKIHLPDMAAVVANVLKTVRQKQASESDTLAQMRQQRDQAAATLQNNVNRLQDETQRLEAQSQKLDEAYHALPPDLQEQLRSLHENIMDSVVDTIENAFHNLLHAAATMGNQQLKDKLEHLFQKFLHQRQPRIQNQPTPNSNPVLHPLLPPTPSQPEADAPEPLDTIHSSRLQRRKKRKTVEVARKIQNQYLENIVKERQAMEKSDKEHHQTTQLKRDQELQALQIQHMTQSDG